MEYDKQTSNSPFQIDQMMSSLSDANHTYSNGQLNLAGQGFCAFDPNQTIPSTANQVDFPVNRHHTPFDIHDKLPLELIEEIIKSCIPRSKPFPLSDGKNDARLQMTQICSTWRILAFGIPALWDVRLEEIFRLSTVSLISAWLRQCSSNQISVQASPTLCWPGFPVTSALFREVIIPNSQRIKALLCLPMRLSDMCPFRWDVLADLSFFGLERDKVSDVCLFTPSLRELGVTKLFYAFQHKILGFLPNLPFEQLTGISLNGILAIEYLYELVPHCPLLERCRLDAIYERAIERRPNVSTLQMPHLKLLSIYFCNRNIFDQLFLFAMPNLSSLSVSHPPSGSQFMERFTTFLATFRHTLLHFELLQTSSHDIAPLEDIMHAVSFVTHFVAKQELIFSPPILGEIWAGDLLPNVEALELSASNDKMVELILSMLLLRQPSQVSRLQCLSILLVGSHDPSYCPSLKIGELRSFGISVNLVHAPL